MPTPKNKKKLLFTALQILFWIAVYAYILLRIKPALYFQLQEPIFYLGFDFFRPFLAEPGGLLRYVADFLAQSFYFPWLGALLLTVTLFLICTVFKLTSRRIKGNGQPLFWLLPAVLLLVLHSNYRHSYAVTLGILIVLTAVWLFLRLVSKSLWRQLVSCAAISVVLYYTTGGLFLLFAVLSAVLLILQRRYLPAGLLIVLAAVLPWIAFQFLFLVAFKEAYTANLVVHEGYIPGFALYITYGLLPGLLLIDKFVKLSYEYLQYAAVFVLAAGLAWFTFNRDLHLVLLAEHHARRGNWEKILKMARRQTPNHRLFENLFFRALYHKNRLPYDIFHYPVYRGDNLFLDSGLAFVTPMQTSDLFFDMGLINEALHWGFEAQTINGLTPWVVQRLAEAYIVKGDRRAADMFVSVLEKSLLFRSRASELRAIIDDPEALNRDKYLKTALIFKSGTDFMTTNPNPLMGVEALVATNPNNRMAIEYLLTHYLMNGYVDNLVKDLVRLNQFKYPDIPVLYQEALCLYLASHAQEKINIPGIKISPDFMRTMDKFKDFMQIYHSGSPGAQMQLKRKYGNTYWYYLLYERRQQKAGDSDLPPWMRGGA